MKRIFMAIGLTVLFFACKTTEKNDMTNVGSIERTDPAFDAIVSADAQIEVLAEGYKWSEGPVWVESEKMLLYSDVPNNIVYKWTEAKGAEQYLTPSGYTGKDEYSRERGSNGLTLSPDGKLVLCQHGDRRVAYMNAPFSAPKPEFVTIADRYDGKRFNSPNDVTFRSNGDMFFTDPPYGLPQQEKDSTREIPFQGVYKHSNGVVSLLVDSLTRPNGIAFMKGEKTLLVANSDPDKAIWYSVDLNESDSVTAVRVFYDATSNSKAGEPGLPDGFRVDQAGNVFASGPGGIWIFNPEGKPLGRIRLTNPAANCELADNDKTLYITNNMYLLRVKLRE